MTWKSHASLVDRRVKSKDGMVVGTVDQLEIDVKSWAVKSLRIEASRALLERLQLPQPNVTGGRTAYIDTADVASVDDDAIHLRVDALDLARLGWGQVSREI